MIYVAQKGVNLVMTKSLFTTEELLVIRAALLNFKKAPFVPDGEKELIDKMMKKIFKRLDKQLSSDN